MGLQGPTAFTPLEISHAMESHTRDTTVKLINRNAKDAKVQAYTMPTAFGRSIAIQKSWKDGRVGSHNACSGWRYTGCKELHGLACFLYNHPMSSLLSCSRRRVCLTKQSTETGVNV